MASSDNKEDEKVENKGTTNETNPSSDSEAKSVDNSTKNNETETKKSPVPVKEEDSDNDDEKIKLVFDDDDDEDIPGDFFDDFLKEDFMAGLDIVDDDDWNDEDKPESASKSNHKPAPKESPVKPKKVNKNEESNVKSKRNAEVADCNEYDVRRDPKKTRRDIERDKERCVKDKEKKIISEKLQLVETGLVPPGTEMEIDMEEIKKQKKDLDHKVKNPVKSLSKSPKRKRSPRDDRNSKRLSPRRIRTPSRKIGEFHKMSPHHIMNPRSGPSVPRDDRSLRRSRSPYSRRGRFSPTNADRRRSSPRRRSSDRRRTPERDSYLRHKRSRSRSSKRRRIDKKKSFLQEIAEKLNETRPRMIQPMMMGPMPPMMQPYHQEMHYMPEHMQMMPEHMQMMPEHMQMAPNQMMPNPMMHAPVPAIVPAPVPAPVPPPSVNPYKPPEQTFDQSFFIGTTTQQNSTTDNLQLSKTTSTQNATPLSNAVNEKNPASEPNKTKPELSDLTKNIIDKLNKNTSDLPKLFQDKKISLSEFLAITAKPEVVASSPANLKEKIKVISRCQDAISFLGTADKKFSGRLVIRKNKKQTPLEPFGNNRSPLISKQPKIPFTEVPTRSELESSFSSYINRLLKHIGVLDDVAVDVDNYIEKDGAKSSPVREDSPPAPPPPPQISKPKKSSESARKKESRVETIRCVECERRARKTFKTSGVQCSQDSIKYSVSTQFPEDDHSVKFPKNLSLASLTPAQLLANSAPTTSRFKDEFDMYGRGRGAPPMQSNDLNYRPRYQPFF